MKNAFYGKLTLHSLPNHWYTITATVFIIISIIVIAAFLTMTKRWGWLWREWLTSTDPKKIGTMYMLFACIMFFRGMVDAGMVWLQHDKAGKKHSKDNKIGHQIDPKTKNFGIRFQFHDPPSFFPFFLPLQPSWYTQYDRQRHVLSRK
jgi:hypothetical protein